MSDDFSCPCGGGPYAECCGPLHSGGAARTAEALMRSRYSAYALGLPEHLLRTWHASTRPACIDLDDDVRWRRLQIVDTALGGADDVTGVVEFRASWRSEGDDRGHGVQHERSRFVLEDGRWLYLGGALR